MTLHTNPNVVCEEICGRYLLISASSEWVSIPYVQEINEQAAFCWRVLEESGDAEEAVKRISEEYEITAEEAEAGFKSLLGQLIPAGYVTEGNADD